RGIQMKFTKSCIAFAGVAIFVGAIAVRPQSTTAATAESTAQPKQSGVDLANRVFETGKLAEAGKLYAQIVAQNPKDYSAILELGRIALLSNRLGEAQKWLEKAMALQPENADPKIMLAEAFYQRDDFQRAAAALKGVNVSSSKMIREQYPAL